MDGTASGTSSLILEKEKTWVATHVPPDVWDEECDVLVLGAGGAGAIAALEALAFGNLMSFSFSGLFASTVNGFELVGIDKETLALVMLIPLTVSIALSLAQVALSLVIGPFMSFATLMSFYVVSVYFQTNLLMGDYSMIARCGLVESGGIDVISIVAISLTVALAAVLAGGILFSKSDLLGT